MFGPPQSLRTFLDKRTESVTAQLAGKSKGYVPASFGFGPGPKGFGPPPPGPGQLIPGFLRDRLNLSTEQKSKLDDLEKEMDAKLEKILTSEQKKLLQKMRQGTPAFGPPGFGPPGGFPNGSQPFPPFQPRKEGKP
jgi:hypothetical protein